MKKLEPLGTNILVRRLPAETMKGGVVIPDSAQREEARAVVVAVGPGKQVEGGYFVEIDHLEPGDEVLIPKYAGADVVDGDDALVLIDAGEIIGVYR